MESSAQRSEELGAEHGMSPEREEIIINSYALHAQKTLPNLGNACLHIVFRSAEIFVLNGD